MQGVDSSALHRLLEVQTHDSAIARLNHRKETLPEAQSLSQVTDTLAELEADLEIANKQAQEIAREQDRLEGEIELLEQKIAREEKRLFSGGVSNPKELSALQAEVAMLKKQRGDMEDSLLEVMVQREQATATLARLRAEQEQATVDKARLTKEVAALTQEIDTDLNGHLTERSELAGAVPEEVLRLYESLRETKGGVGAAALRGGTCAGCHTQLPAKEVERLKAEGGLQRCDNCRRILVI